MAAAEGAQTLKCNKWVLKVPIHCLGCKTEIKKVLHSIDGVYTTSIDPEQQQVTVTGNIDSEILLKKLSKTGKHAEICTAKSGEKCKKNEKPSDPKPSQKKEQITATFNDAQKKPDNKPETNTEERQPGKCGKMKKDKGQNGNSAVDGKGKVAPGSSTGLLKANLSPTFEQLGPTVTNTESPTTVQVLSYNAAYSTKVEPGVSYQIPSAPAYISYSTNGETGSYQVEAATEFSSFDIFSDENPNGCSVM